MQFVCNIFSRNVGCQAELQPRNVEKRFSQLAQVRPVQNQQRHWPSAGPGKSGVAHRPCHKYNLSILLFSKQRVKNDKFVENFVMQHDSFNCENHSFKAAGVMRPFPICRNMSSSQLYVGYRPESKAVIATAPKNCRINKTCVHG